MGFLGIIFEYSFFNFTDEIIFLTDMKKFIVKFYVKLKYLLYLIFKQRIL